MFCLDLQTTQKVLLILQKGNFSNEKKISVLVFIILVLLQICNNDSFSVQSHQR